MSKLTLSNLLRSALDDSSVRSAVNRILDLEPKERIFKGSVIRIV